MSNKDRLLLTLHYCTTVSVLSHQPSVPCLVWQGNAAHAHQQVGLSGLTMACQQIGQYGAFYVVMCWIIELSLIFPLG